MVYYDQSLSDFVNVCVQCAELIVYKTRMYVDNFFSENIEIIGSWEGAGLMTVAD